VNAVMVVVMDLLINAGNQLANGIKAIRITKFLLEAAIKGFLVAILPWGSDIADRDLDAALLQISGATFGQKLIALIAMEDRGLRAACQGALERGQDQMTIVLLTKTCGHDLACGDILNRHQIPEFSPIAKRRQITTPHLMRLLNGKVGKQITVGMRAGGAGGIALDSPSRWAQLVFCHDPLRAFVVDAQMQSHAAMTISRMLAMRGCDLFCEGCIFCR